MKKSIKKMVLLTAALAMFGSAGAMKDEANNKKNEEFKAELPGVPQPQEQVEKTKVEDENSSTAQKYRTHYPDARSKIENEASEIARIEEEATKQGREVCEWIQNTARACAVWILNDDDPRYEEQRQEIERLDVRDMSRERTLGKILGDKFMSERVLTMTERLQGCYKRVDRLVDHMQYRYKLLRSDLDEVAPYKIVPPSEERADLKLWAADIDEIKIISNILRMAKEVSNRYHDWGNSEKNNWGTAKMMVDEVDRVVGGLEGITKAARGKARTEYIVNPLKVDSNTDKAPDLDNLNAMKRAREGMARERFWKTGTEHASRRWGKNVLHNLNSKISLPEMETARNELVALLKELSGEGPALMQKLKFAREWYNAYIKCRAILEQNVANKSFDRNLRAAANLSVEDPACEG